jgi:hypothetical protein
MKNENSSLKSYQISHEDVVRILESSDPGLLDQTWHNSRNDSFNKENISETKNEDPLFRKEGDTMMTMKQSSSTIADESTHASIRSGMPQPQNEFHALQNVLRTEYGAITNTTLILLLHPLLLDWKRSLERYHQRLLKYKREEARKNCEYMWQKAEIERQQNELQRNKSTIPGTNIPAIDAATGNAAIVASSYSFSSKHAYSRRANLQRISSSREGLATNKETLATSTLSTNTQPSPSSLDHSKASDNSSINHSAYTLNPTTQKSSHDVDLIGEKRINDSTSSSSSNKLVTVCH